MTRVILLVSLFLLISIDSWGQCVNPPTVTLTSTSGSTCGTTPVTVNGNTFGGSATKVTITANGTGSVSPASEKKSPFAFTYTPKSGDSGKNVLITVTTDFPQGCTAAKATYTLSVNAVPSAPVVGTITKPTCAIATGSVVLSGLPSTGTWTITRSPGGITTGGTGTTVTISAISSGTYTFIITSSTGCSSSASSNVVIPAQPASPANPVQTIDCNLGISKAKVTVTSPTGTGLTYCLDAGAYQSGTSFSNVVNGSHTVTVKNSAGCTTTGASFQVSCGCVNQPTVTLSSTNGNTCGITPVTVSGNTFGGSATSVTITENGAGTVSPASSNTKPFAFTYTPIAGDIGNTVIITVTTNNPLGLPCASATATYSLTVVAIPSAPLIGIITQPTCSIAAASVVLNGLPAIGTWTLTRSPGGVITTGTGTSTTVAGLVTGTYTYSVAVAGCTSIASANVVINSQQSTPAAPVVGTVTQPTCSVPTGSVILNGLPATGIWTITRSPDGSITTGTGNTSTLSGLSAGTYTFTVANSSGCISGSSANVIISLQSSTPGAPVIGTIIQPICSVSTGSVILSGLPSTGTWTLIRSPGGLITTGSGTSITIPNLSEGTYSFTVTNTLGCISPSSGNIVISAQPVTPSPPIIGTITQPHSGLLTGSVVLNGLPETGNWTLTLIPGNIISFGNGSTRTISGLAVGTYSFTVTNSAACTSGQSASFAINQATDYPDVVITNPAPVCSPSTIDLTAAAITSGSSLNLTFTYWTDAEGKIPFVSPRTAPAGTYYIKGTATDGSSAIKPVTVTVYQIPLPDAGPDQVLSHQFEATMDAHLAHNYETGVWSLISGTGEFFDSTYAKTNVSSLSMGANLFLWAVTNKVCLSASDTITINVRGLALETLITPNMDGKNDYFIVKRSDSLGKVKLIIFDRRGVQVYKKEDYNNSWNGVDYYGKNLPDDTYFYIIKTENGISENGYIVVRR